MTGCKEHIRLSRRQLLVAGTSLAMWGLMPRIASAAGARDPRLLVVILRGGLDGLALAAPAADPDLVRLRGPLALAAAGEGAGLPLDMPFVLNPAMPFLHALYQRKQALVAHAIASPYRERSHFDGQDMLESGLPGVGRVDSGWLNRALAAIAKAGGTSSRADPRGLAMGAVVPLLMRGEAPVLSWIPKTFSLPLRESTIGRLTDLYAQTDPGLARAFAEGIEIDRVAAATAATGATPSPAGPMRELVDTAQTAARFMAAADGPRVGVLSFNGWDTHAAEGALKGQLANRLAGLDTALKSYADGMGDAWTHTVVAIVTEFGRTARINGTEGTDHGTATVALLAGGAVRGGRVLTDWPGLSDSALHEGRDLKPTQDLRALLKGVLRDHLGLPEAVLSERVFPQSGGARSLDGLIA